MPASGGGCAPDAPHGGAHLWASVSPQCRHPSGWLHPDHQFPLIKSSGHCCPHPTSQILLFRGPLPPASSRQPQDSVSPSVALTGWVTVSGGGPTPAPGAWQPRSTHRPEEGAAGPGVWPGQGGPAASHLGARPCGAPAGPRVPGGWALERSLRTRETAAASLEFGVWESRGTPEQL